MLVDPVIQVFFGQVKRLVRFWLEGQKRVCIESVVVRARMMVLFAWVGSWRELWLVSVHVGRLSARRAFGGCLGTRRR